jgi:hypothetical protein
MSSTNYAERMAIRNASTLAQAPANYASFLIENIALAVQDINDPRDRLATQVGRLQGTVRMLCNKVEAYTDFAEALGRIAERDDEAGEIARRALEVAGKA